MSDSLLLIEDDEHLAKLIQETASPLGMTVTIIANGNLGLQAALENNFDAVVLDIGLPGMNGLDVCKELRAKKPELPILFLSSLSQETEVVLGLELGADDYVTKPFRPRELISRVRAIIGRYRRLKKLSAGTGTSNALRNDSEPAAGSAATPGVYQEKDIKVDFNKFELISHGNVVPLSTQEWMILELLLARPGVAVSRDALIETVWGEYDPDYEKLLTRLMWRVRERIQGPQAAGGNEETEAESGNGFILTVRGIGYRWNK